ncbi:MAG TPA: glycosyltransferase [Thermoanaerobaculia bacterium]|nr:glycosyltransferase [Thermoanaerobaculia bacterium]
MLPHPAPPAAPAPVGWFFLPGDTAHLATLDPERDWRELLVGERAWVLQSYLRLARSGLPVALTSRPTEGLVVFHAKHWRALQRQRADGGTAILVSVRADLRPAPNADFEIVQNRGSADGRRRFYVPHWPQPSLLGRDPGRGDLLRRAGYRGLAGHLHPALRDRGWVTLLDAAGFEWDVDAPIDLENEAARATSRWSDYRELDALVALRPPDRRLYPAKPPTKLFNAWCAGVPAILGPERAYREERRDPLDYLEVDGPLGAVAALRGLAREPRRYRAMVEHGLRRAAEHGAGAVASWRELLCQVLPERAREAPSRRRRRWPAAARLALGYLRRRLSVR